MAWPLSDPDTVTLAQSFHSPLSHSSLQNQFCCQPEMKSGPFCHSCIVFRVPSSWTWGNIFLGSCFGAGNDFSGILSVIPSSSKWTGIFRGWSIHSWGLMFKAPVLRFSIEYEIPPYCAEPSGSGSISLCTLLAHNFVCSLFLIKLNTSCFSINLDKRRKPSCTWVLCFSLGLET